MYIMLPESGSGERIRQSGPVPFHYACAAAVPLAPVLPALPNGAALPATLRTLALRNSHDVHRALRQRAVGWG